MDEERVTTFSLFAHMMRRKARRRRRGSTAAANFRRESISWPPLIPAGSTHSLASPARASQQPLEPGVSCSHRRLVCRETRLLASQLSAPSTDLRRRPIGVCSSRSQQQRSRDINLFVVVMATARRDTLLELQAKAQKKWADEKTFEVTAPRDGESSPNHPTLSRKFLAASFHAPAPRCDRGTRYIIPHPCRIRFIVFSRRPPATARRERRELPCAHPIVAFFFFFFPAP